MNHSERKESRKITFYGNIGSIICKWFLLTQVGRKAAVCLLHYSNRTVYDMSHSLTVESKWHQNLGIH